MRELFQHAAITHGITVRVAVNFLPEQSRIDAGKYAEGLALAQQALARARSSSDRGARAEAELLAGILQGRQVVLKERKQYFKKT